MVFLIHKRKKEKDLFLKDRKVIVLDIGEYNNEKKNVTRSEDTGEGSQCS